MQTKRAFFKEAVKNLKSSGAIVPSSRFLAKRMLLNIDFSKRLNIVEFGPGNGSLTKDLLINLSKDSRLISFEVNDQFFSYLARINDKRFTLLKKSAEDIHTEIAGLDIEKVDYIISSLPLTNLPKKVTKNILKNSYNSLKNKGLLIQYQYSLTYYKKLKKVFKNQVDLEFEIRNIPPAFIYICKK